ncbi:MAG TPA: hypothetical protein VMR62_04105 [Bryobacteraceae bacterium]|jgi:hypothetical protein|nr:hypothetical protein [Bryobacteraceae bacterium]
MIRDCRADLPAGWSYFVTQYVPVVRGFLAHYYPDRTDGPAMMERVLAKLREPGSNLFQSLDPAPERAFVAELRQHVLRAVEADRATAAPEVTIDIEALGEALEPLTVTERLAVWFETMRYGDADTGRMLRMSPQTTQQIRTRGGELIRGHVDAWRSTLLADNGRLLGQAAGALSNKDCLPAKSFFDVIDGRATWRWREEMEQHVKGCWHCLDHYCRLLEAVDILRAAQPLSETEVAPYLRMLGIETRKRSFWAKKRF